MRERDRERLESYRFAFTTMLTIVFFLVSCLNAPSAGDPPYPAPPPSPQQTPSGQLI